MRIILKSKTAIKALPTAKLAGALGVGLCAWLSLGSGLMAQTSEPKKKTDGASSSREPYYVDGVEYKPYVPDAQKKPAKRPSVSNGVAGTAPAIDTQSYPVFSKPVQEATPITPGTDTDRPAPSGAPVDSGVSSSSTSAPPPRVAPGVSAMPGTISGAGAASADPAAVAHPEKRQRYSVAIVRALDKVTAESVMFEARIGQPVRFKGLIYMVRACETTALDEARPDVIAYLEVRANVTARATATQASPIFRGWTFASSPGLNPMQHAVYDAWVIACKSPIS